MRTSALLLAAAVLFSRGAACATPAQVVLIRHGEKPDDGPELNERGWQRARALVSFFLDDATMSQFGKPAAIFAMAPKGEDGSVRAVQTVTPLADKLGLQVRAAFTKNKIQPLVRAVLDDSAFTGKTVVICWEHKVIPSIAQALGARSAPSRWPGDAYDRAWVIRFAGDQVLSFQDLPEHLLPGDTDD